MFHTTVESCCAAFFPPNQCKKYDDWCAGKTASDGGTVTVSIMEEDNHKHIVVEDSGPGIPEEEYEKVFQRFYRVTEGNHEGTGLGLAMVQRIIEIHRAAIEFGKSRYGGLKVDVCFAEPLTA